MAQAHSDSRLSADISLPDLLAWLDQGAKDPAAWLVPGAAERLMKVCDDRLVAPNWIIPAALAILRDQDKVLWEEADRGVPSQDLPRLAAMFAGPLGAYVLSQCIVPTPNAEILLTTARRLLLDRIFRSVETAPPSGSELRLAVAIAQQCFLNEYCYWQGGAENLWIDILGENIRTALVEGQEIAPFEFADMAAYAAPLSIFPEDTLLRLRNDPHLADLIERMVVEPLQERALASRIPQRTRITNTTSLAVQEMYEQNPYPRWISSAQRVPSPVGEVIKRQFPTAEIAAFEGGRTKALIAGCGTGQQVVEFSSQIDARTEVTAIDLSLASLCYAKRQTDNLGIRVSYEQADIMEMEHRSEQFDLIDCSGVLHHVADPIAGWKNLASCLRPGGIMRLALYSSASRPWVADASRFIANNALQPTPQGIRQFRRDMIAQVWGPVLVPERLLSIIRFLDFYNTSMCRDLVFHVQAVHFTMREILRVTETLGLKFLSLTFHKDSIAQIYRSRFPQDPYVNIPECLLQFEAEHPEAFYRMIQFGVQKPH